MLSCCAIRRPVPGDPVLHVTVVKPAAAGAVSVYPCGSVRSLATTLRFNAGATVGNSATTKLGTGGTVCVHTTAATQVVVDVAGAYPAGNAFVPVNPARLADTRWRNISSPSFRRRA